MLTSARIAKTVNSIALTLVLLAIMIWRRRDQLLHPYVWVEEGTVTLPAYLSQGWPSIASPVAGYLVVPAKLIFLIAASVSFRYLPEIAYALTIAFSVGTLCLIAYSPSTLKYPKLAALCVALVPTDPEVFGVSEYAFWWGSLWSFVAIFWKEGARPSPWWRCILVGVGGLSSPMALPAAAILAIRAAWMRRRCDLYVLIGAAGAAAFQLYVMHSAGTAPDPNTSAIDPTMLLQKMVGNFVYSSRYSGRMITFVSGCAILATLAAYFVRQRKWSDPAFTMLVAAFAVSILASITRMPLHQVDPVQAGPRYFFYPFIFLSWMLLFMLAEGTRWQQVVATVSLAAAVIQVADHGQRRHDPLDWRAEIEGCRSSAGAAYRLPVHYDGQRESAWRVNLTSSECEALVQRSLFR